MIIREGERQTDKQTEDFVPEITFLGRNIVQ